MSTINEHAKRVGVTIITAEASRIGSDELHSVEYE